MSKLPFRPKVAGKIAFFFGPIAGAMVTVVNLRRLGFPVKAMHVLRWTLLGSLLLAIIIMVIPDALGRVVGIGAEIAFYAIYPGLQSKEFDEWEVAHPGIEPRNGWTALGWGFAGLALFLAIAVGVAIVIAIVFPSLA